MFPNNHEGRLSLPQVHPNVSTLSSETSHSEALCIPASSPTIAPSNLDEEQSSYFHLIELPLLQIHWIVQIFDFGEPMSAHPQDIVQASTL